MTNRAARKFPLQLDRLAPASKAGVDGTPRETSGRALLRPQAPLMHVASQARQRAVPTGLGLDSADVRERMVSRLRTAGVRDESVLAAMASVPRHLFVDSGLVNQAYEDTSLPIGHGQTISKPSVVARMIEWLAGGAVATQTGSLGQVLEIGTGCGYQAAVLACLSRQVMSVERIQPLHVKARQHLSSLRETRVRLVYGDGTLGHAPNAPYQSIIAAAGGDTVPQAWLDQLAVGGRLVAPVRTQGQQQMLVVIDRSERGYTRSVHESVHFVPLRSGLD